MPVDVEIYSGSIPQVVTTAKGPMLANGTGGITIDTSGSVTANSTGSDYGENPASTDETKGGAFGLLGLGSHIGLGGSGVATGGNADGTAGDWGDDYIGWLGFAMTSLDSDVAIAGGTATGGSASGGAGRPAHFHVNPTSFLISGGTHTGGDGDTTSGNGGIGGCAVWLMLATGLGATFSGGTFTPGVGDPDVGAEVAPALILEGGGTVDISGGTWSGDWQFRLDSGGTVTVTGSSLTWTPGPGPYDGVLAGTIDGISQSIVVLDLTGGSMTVSGSGSSVVFSVP